MGLTARLTAQWTHAAFPQTFHSAGVHVREKPEVWASLLSRRLNLITLRMSHMEKGWGCSVQRCTS